MQKLLRRGKYFSLLAGLVLLGLAYPMLELGRLGAATWTGLLWLVAIGGLQAIGTHRRFFQVAAVLTALIIGTGIWMYVGEAPGWVVVGAHAIELTFFALATSLVLFDVFRAHHVSVNQLVGAICGYLMIGMTWAFLYTVTDALRPGSLVVGGIPSSVELSDRSEYLYHSFVTLTTLGYGDSVPVSAPMRLFSAAEAIVGQIYVTILVARLVGLHLIRSKVATREKGSD